MKNFAGLKGIASVGFADSAGSGIAAIFWFFLASQISPEEYGGIFYFLGIVGLAQIISLVGTSHIITVYAAKGENIHGTFYIISFIVGVISSIILYYFFNRIDVSILIFAFIIMVLSNATIIGKKLYLHYMIFVFIQKGLTLVLGISFFFLFGVDGILYALAISSIPYLIIIIKELKNSRIDFSFIKSRKKFIFGNYVMMISSGLRRDIDKIIIPMVLGFSYLGNYALALQVIMVLMIIPQVVFKYILPQEASGIQKPFVKKLTLVILIFVTGFTLIAAPTIIPIFFEKYNDATTLIQIMSLSLIPGAIGLFYTSKFLSVEDSISLLFATLIQFAILVSGMIFLTPILDVIGLAISFVMATASHAIFLWLRFKQKKI